MALQLSEIRKRVVLAVAAVQHRLSARAELARLAPPIKAMRVERAITMAATVARVLAVVALERLAEMELFLEQPQPEVRPLALAAMA